MLKLKRGLSMLLALIGIGILFVGCSSSDNYVTVNGRGTSNSEFLFSLKASMYNILVSTPQSQSTKEFWTTKVDGVSPFDKALEQSVKSNTINAVVDKTYNDYKITWAKEQDEQFNSAYQKLVSNFSTKDEYVSYMKKQGITDADVVEILKRNIRQNQLKNYLFSQGGELFISDDDLKKEYNENYFRAKHILFLTVDTTTFQPLSDEKVTQAKNDADATLIKAKNGQDFDKLMREKSQDPGSLAAENGDGYIFTSGEMDPAFEEATKNLKVGQISDLVKSSFGYHIIKRLDLNEKPELFENKKAEILEQFKNTKYEKLLEKWADEAKVEKNMTKINTIDPMELFKIESGSEQ